jgi:hypothetical protein
MTVLGQTAVRKIDQPLPVLASKPTIPEPGWTSHTGQQQTHALQQDALDFGFALAAMAAGSVQ